MLTLEDLQGIDLLQPSVLDRYYEKRYLIDAGKQEANDHLVAQHHNKICVIMIAPHHLLHSKIIESVSFQISDSCDRSDIVLSGKKKRGAPFLTPNSKLCVVTCTDGTVCNLYACIRGKLLEVNEALKTDPGLLTKYSTSDGYIAVIQPKWEEQGSVLEGLPDQKGYEKLRKRQQSAEVLASV